MLRVNGDRYGDKPAVLYYDRTVSFHELDEASDRVAGALELMGVKKGEIVSMMMNNSPEFYAVFFGIQKAGAVAGPVNCWWQTNEVEYLLNDSGTRIFIVDGDYAHHVEALKGRTGVGKLVLNETDDPPAGEERLSDILSSGAEARMTDHVTPESPGAILYTSGTTGKPKGALLTHKNLMFAGQAKARGPRTLPTPTAPSAFSRCSTAPVFWT